MLKKHNAHRCSDCKTAVIKLLSKLYGRIEINPKIEISVRLDDLKDTSAYKALSRIHSALTNYRGHKAFTRTRSLPRSDFLVVGRNQLVEFDELQHFSKARAVALAEYPRTLLTGYSRKRWLELCSFHEARDNDPLYRDEQRAWYDTLRDFLPMLEGLRPTVRLYAAERCWCDLSIQSKADLSTFEQVIEKHT